MQTNSGNMTGNENNLRNIHRQTAENRKPRDRYTYHLKLNNKRNAAVEDEENWQLKVEKYSGSSKKYI